MKNPIILTSSITALAAAIFEAVTNDEADLLGAAFTQLGDTITTMSAAKQLCKDNEKA